MSQDLPERTKQLLAAQNKSTVSIVITSSDANNHFAFEREDYTADTMALANAQAVGVTEEAKNTYTIQGEHQIRNLTVGGYPAAIQNDGPGGDHVFSDEFNTPTLRNAKSAFENSSNTRTLGMNVVKGKALPASQLDVGYIDLLQDITSNPNDNRLSRALDRIAEENNLNGTPAKPYLTIGQKEKDTNIGRVILQNEPGVHIPKKIGGNGTESQTTIELKLQTLKNLGLQLMMKSSGEFTTITNESDFGEVLAARASSLAPGPARLGAKIPMSSLSPLNIVRNANPDFEQSNSSLLQPDDSLTFGSYNSPLVPFNGIDTRSSMAAASILIATLTLLFEALSRAFDPRLGLQSPIFRSITNQVQGITVSTESDYSECVRMGMAVFFGNASGDLASIVGSGFEKLNESPGWYNTILRNLVQSITHEVGQSLFLAAIPPGVIDGFVGPIDTNSAANIKPAGLSLDVGSNLTSAFARISQSRVVGFMNVLASIGDIYLSLRAKDLIGTDGRVIGYDALITDVAEGVDGTTILNPASIIRRDRISGEANSTVVHIPGGKQPLAWAASTTPSKFILPNSILVAASDLGGRGEDQNLLTKLSAERGMTIADSGRLSADIVKQLEDDLDSSYVPFYFHDLRTNEIVSFHAFLSEMTDGFTAEYSETSGYGRVGKVYTYKNTDRSISFGFVVAATSDADFQRMWWKINKLITTVYPQYTAGRTIEYNGERFVQPFSQLPSSSPLMRIRLGDVWKSNYSKFALARLFGLGQGQDRFALNQQNIDTERQNANSYREALDSVRQRMSRNDFSLRERFYFQYEAPAAVGRRTQRGQVAMPLGAPESSFVLHRVPEEATSSTPATTTPRGGTTSQQTQTLVSGRYLLRVITKVPEQDVTQVPSTIGTGTQTASSNTTLYKVQIDDAPSSSRSTQYYLRLPNVVDSHSASPAQAAMVTLYDPDVEAAARQIVAGASTAITGSQDQQNTTNLVQDFFKSTGENANPIFKSFESTKGKGLAGFVKAIKLDWNESVWSVDGYNGKAPTLLKVNIDFAPIHDIQPGIDNNGFTTAPVYRVGEISDALNTSVAQDKTENIARRERYNTLIGSAQRRSPR